MEFKNNVDLPEHSHAAQIGIVLEGKIDLTIDGKQATYEKGDRYYIPEGVLHSGKIYAVISHFLMNVIGIRRNNNTTSQPTRPATLRRIECQLLQKD